MRPSGEILRLETPNAVVVILVPTVKTIGESEGSGGRMPVYSMGDATIYSPEGQALYDDVTYQLQISARKRVEVTLGHRPLRLHWASHGSLQVATSPLTFRQVGWAELLVEDDGARIQVLSRKMDYDTDYQAMVYDLENQVRGLTARLVSHLLNPMDVSNDSLDLWSYWLALLEKLWEDLAGDIGYAWRTLPPHLRAEDQVTRIERLKKPQGRDVRAFARGNPRFSATVLRWESVTPERLYLLQLLQDVHRRLRRIEASAPEVAGNRRLAAITQSSSWLLRTLSAAVEMERVVGSPIIPVSPLAQSHPAMRRVVRWHRLLKRGLFPDGDSYFVGPKDISQLYEYWCYLTIVRMVVEESGGDLTVKPTTSVHPQDISLGGGKDSAARVELRDGNTINIMYQRLFSGLPTVAQQPDHVVQIEGMGSVVIFDAKYRFELDDGNFKHYGEGLPIPPVSTINSMHQYHDAIVLSRAPFTRLVDRAIVLFPLPREHIEQWEEHRFYRSINAVGVGAIPLVPGGSDKYLRAEIQRYLTENAISKQESDVD